MLLTIPVQSREYWRSGNKNQAVRFKYNEEGGIFINHVKEEITYE